MGLEGSSRGRDRLGGPLLLGIVLGLILGTGLSLVILPILGGLVGLDLPPVVDAATLWTAAGFGALTGFAFEVCPTAGPLKREARALAKAKPR